MNRRRQPDDTPTAGAESRWRQVAQRQYDPDGRTELTTDIVYAVAAAKGVSPDEVNPPLYSYVDVPAIKDAFFGPENDTNPSQSVGSVRFHYVGYLVTIESDGWIQVYEADDDGDAIAD